MLNTLLHCVLFSIGTLSFGQNHPDVHYSFDNIVYYKDGKTTSMQEKFSFTFTDSLITQKVFPSGHLIEKYSVDTIIFYGDRVVNNRTLKDYQEWMLIDSQKKKYTLMLYREGRTWQLEFYYTHNDAVRSRIFY